MQRLQQWLQQQQQQQQQQLLVVVKAGGGGGGLLGAAGGQRWVHRQRVLLGLYEGPRNREGLFPPLACIARARPTCRSLQNRVEQNLQRINELKAEAARLARTQQQPAAAPAPAASAAPQARQQPPAAPAPLAAPGSSGGREARQSKRGLCSSLDFEDGLRNYWYIVQFSHKLTEGMMVPFDLFGEPWVLFRDEHGRAACLRDECAHRACPLSLGKVVNGQAECPYHGEPLPP
jgi:hypothetical protein